MSNTYNFTPVSGRFAKVSLKDTPTAATDYDLAAVDWKIDADAKVANASNFRDGRRALGTLPDATLTVTLCWDANDHPTKTTMQNLRLGATGTAKCYTDGDASTSPTKFWAFPFVVSKISPASQVEGEIVKMPVTLTLNGDLTYPISS